MTDGKPQGAVEEKPKTREQIYNDSVAPLVATILKICEVHHIPCVMAFGTREGNKDYEVTYSAVIGDDAPCTMVIFSEMLDDPMRAATVAYILDHMDNRNKIIVPH